MDLNSLSITGRLTRDAEIKYVGAKTTALVKFSVANNTGAGSYAKTTYFDCALWGKAAEVLHDYLVKGQAVALQGKFESNDYTNESTGLKVKAYQFTVDQCALIGKRGDTSVSDNGSNSDKEEDVEY